MNFQPSMQGFMGGAGIGSMIGNMFNNPADIYSSGMNQGMDYIKNATGQAENAIHGGINQATGYQQPFYSAGQQGLNNWMGMLGRYNNPQEYYNQIMGGWKMSPGAQSKMGGAMDALKNSMASRGMMGSGQEMKDLGKTYEDYASQDQQQYFNNISGLGNTGLQGYGNLAMMGQNAANNMGNYAYGGGNNIANVHMQGAEDVTSMMNAIAQAKAQQAANENKDTGGFLGGIGSMLGGKLGWL